MLFTSLTYDTACYLLERSQLVCNIDYNKQETLEKFQCLFPKHKPVSIFQVITVDNIEVSSRSEKLLKKFTQQIQAYGVEKLISLDIVFSIQDLMRFILIQWVIGIPYHYELYSIISLLSIVKLTQPNHCFFNDFYNQYEKSNKVYNYYLTRFFEELVLFNRVSNPVLIQKIIVYQKHMSVFNYINRPLLKVSEFLMLLDMLEDKQKKLNGQEKNKRLLKILSTL